MNRTAFALTFVVCLTTTRSISRPELELSPREINQQAYDAARKVGEPGSVAFTVAFRRNVARLNGDEVFANAPSREIELGLTYRTNVLKGLERFADIRGFHAKAIPVTGFESVVAIFNTSGELSCTGFAIEKRKIVTAGHCVDDADEVLEGKTTIGARHIPVARGKGKKFGLADVGVLFLDEDVSTSTFFPRATTAELDTASHLHAMGFGLTESGTQGENKSIDVAIATLHCDQPGDQKRFGCTPPFELVADDPKNHSDSCKGDSGGPAFVDPKKPDRIGAIIRKGANGKDCVDGTIYVRLDSREVDDFINNATRSTPPR